MSMTPPVLVTGAGGYIASALVKAIAASHPSGIILLDSSEHNLFEIQQNLAEAHKDVSSQAILGSVTDPDLLDSVFARFCPSIVFHAAAAKHVPLLEFNPLAAVQINALGTYRTAQAALRHGASTLVLVSTDKAVNPHSIMGASKRLAELTVAALSSPACKMNVVRLANVKGSSGSVLPIFQNQIARGGPVTVTHPGARRYFMSRHAAVEAILAGGAAQCSGRILLPELGQPERIADLAKALIGSKNDIELQIVGLRPGEKMEEDLVYPAEVREGFTNERLVVLRTPSPAAAEIHSLMGQLACHLAARDITALVETIRRIIPQYQPSSLILEAIEAPGSVAG